MYLSFYGLKIKPFQNSTNPEFFWFGEKQKETLAIFKYGLSKMPGILLLTGDAGAGKTTLANVFLNSLGDKFIVVKIPDPDLEDIDFMNYIADALDFKTRFSDKDTFFAAFSHFLDITSTLGKRVILVIDECQGLSSRLLEEIIKLANIEKDETKLLKILLIGQNEFDDLLKKNTSRVLHQLIAINYAIAALNLHETGEFIKHRLKIAGANRDIFSPEAITKIYEISGGIPCKINIICDIALLYGFGQKSKTVNGELIWECTENLRPQKFANVPGKNHSLFDAGNDSKRLWKKSSASPVNDADANPWRGKMLGISILVIIPVFLITYFSDLRNFFSPPHRVVTQIRTQTSDPPIHKISAEATGTVTDSGKFTPLSSLSDSKDEVKNDLSVNKPAGKNYLPAAEPHRKDLAVEKVLKNADRPSRTGELPVIDPIDAARDSENSSSAQIISPLATDRQTIPHDQTIQKAATPTNAAGINQSALKLNQDETAKIEKERRPDQEVPHPDVSPAEKEISETPAPSRIPVTKENNPESREHLDGKGDAEAKVTIAPNTQKENQDAMPDIAPKSGNAEETEPEGKAPPIDPGAIIDWVLKNRPK